MEDYQILVSAKEYRELQDAADKLDKLERAGVDNWEGYDFAMEDDQD